MRRAKSCLGLVTGLEPVPHHDPEGHKQSGKLPGKPLGQGEGHTARFSGRKCALGGAGRGRASKREDSVRERGETV